MRHVIALLGLVGTMVLMGCHHVGGKCDCGPQHGDGGAYTSFSKEPAALAGYYEELPAPPKTEKAR